MTPRKTDHSQRSDIAIIGMSGRFPGARTIDAFWQNLKDGVESRTFFSDEEITAQGVPAAALSYPQFVKSGFVLDEIEAFDSQFFGFTPREADVMDPQHRLFLECAWETLEDAGYDSERYSGSVAVFGGATYAGYLSHNVMRNARIVKSVGGRQAVYGCVPEYMVMRVSYKLNLRGPCYFVQTACSTSLVAVHLGCQSLANHECDMVLAGGVSVQLPHRLGYLYEEGGMLSPDGVCRTFDIRAKGTVFSSGVAIVLLKRLEEAIADGDQIYAVIKGIATNNDGAFKVGFTAPSVTGQAQVIAEAMANAGVNPETISYVEAHGTGTELGDPIEVSALTRAYRASTDRAGYCAIGSVKPNVGHLDAAAGVSSLIKTVLALRHQQIPPTINFEHSNPKIDFESSPFFVNTALRPWPVNGTPRRAGVSSFGFGGTNAHVIVEEAPAIEASSGGRGEQVLLLSAKTEEALDAATRRLADHLAERRQLNLADVAYTLQVGRRLFKHRRAAVCSSVADAVETLQGGDPRRVYTGEAGAAKPVVFMFPGQGSQYVNMGIGLYRDEAVFRAVVDECCDALQPHLGFDLREVLYPADGPSDETSERLKQTAVTQSALFVVELAMARLWMSWGVKPAAMIGHSIGEFVAACLAGVFSVADALRLVACRGRLMGEMRPGVMLAVPVPEADLHGLLGADLWLSAINAPALSVVSGDRDAIDRLVDQLHRQGVESRPLHTSHAFHSGMMDGAVEPLVEIAKTIELHAPQIPYISNVTGTWITEAQAREPEYWGRHLRQAVRFSAGVAELLKDSERVFLELGPGSALSTLVRQQARNQFAIGAVSTLRQAHDQTPDSTVLMSAVGRLWTAGASLDWTAFHAEARPHRVSLPTYPFARTRHWVDPELLNRSQARVLGAQHEFMFFEDWFHVPTWKRSRSAASLTLAPGSTPPANCLVFLDRTGVGERLAARLAAGGQRVVTVEEGSEFASLGPHRYAIAPAARADYGRLVNALRASNQMPDTIAHLWSLTREIARDTGRTEEIAARGFYSLLYFAQALGEAAGTTPIRLVAVSDGVHQVLGDEPLVPEKATMIGPLRVIPQEFPHVAARLIDLDSRAAVDDRQIDALAGELFATGTDTMVAYRSNRRWERVFDPFYLEAAGDELPARLRERGVYLITGGLGGVGLVLARDLARAAKARLVLTGRRGLPPRETWQEFLASRGPLDPTSRKIQAVIDLESLGAEVLIGAADVVDEAAMQAVVDQACARFGRIDGVVHAAGIAGGGMIQLKKREVAAAVLAPKVVGTQVLERVLAGQRLDFLMLCSSLTGVLGGLGQVDYCGANAYLDAFAAHHAAATGTFTVAVNWNAWREVGMAVDTEVPDDLKTLLKGQMLQSGISNEQGADAFRRILRHVSDCQIAVSPHELQLLLEAQGRTADADAAVEQGAVDHPAMSAGKGHPRPNLSTPFVAASTDTQRKLCAVWQEMLGIDRVGINDNFFDLGGHSLLAVQVMARSNQGLNASVPVAKLYEGLTIAFLASLMAPRAQVVAIADAESDDSIERRREKARRQKEHQQRRRVALGR
jgi:acyl transferase domain-containing protein